MVIKHLFLTTISEPFRAKMLPPLENRAGRRDKLIVLSRERYAMRREKIEARLRRWTGHESSVNFHPPNKRFSVIDTLEDLGY
jgi:hypothetical protein